MLCHTVDSPSVLSVDATLGGGSPRSTVRESRMGAEEILERGQTVGSAHACFGAHVYTLPRLQHSAAAARAPQPTGAHGARLDCGQEEVNQRKREEEWGGGGNLSFASEDRSKKAPERKTNPLCSLASSASRRFARTPPTTLPRITSPAISPSRPHRSPAHVRPSSDTHTHTQTKATRRKKRFLVIRPVVSGHPGLDKLTTAGSRGSRAGIVASTRTRRTPCTPKKEARRRGRKNQGIDSIREVRRVMLKETRQT